MSPENVLTSDTVQPPAWNRWAATVAVVLLELFSTTSGNLAMPAAEVLAFGVDATPDDPEPGDAEPDDPEPDVALVVGLVLVGAFEALDDARLLAPADVRAGLLSVALAAGRPFG